MEYALVGPDDTISTIQTNVDPSVSTRAGWRWLPVATTPPVYDPATQVVSPQILTVLANVVTRTYTVRDKTAQELDDDKTRVLGRVDTLVFKVLFDHENRVRALEGKAAITVTQFKTALKARL